MQEEAEWHQHPRSGPGVSASGLGSVCAISIQGLLLGEEIHAARVHGLFLGCRLPRAFSRDPIGGMGRSLHLFLQVPFEEADLEEDQN